MAALMRVTVSHDDGTEATHDVKPATIVTFERQFNIGIGAMATEQRMEWIYFLAYDAEKRSGAIMPPTFDAWLEKVADVDLVEEAAPLANPTQEESPASV